MQKKIYVIFLDIEFFFFLFFVCIFSIHCQEKIEKSSRG